MKTRATCTATPRNGRHSGFKDAALLAVCASMLATEARADVTVITYQDSDDWLAAPSYIQSPVLDAGIGEIGFRYRVLDPASQTPGKLTLWVADSPEAGENEWRQITADDLDRPGMPAASAPYAEWASYAARYDAFEEQAEMLGSLANITNGDYQYFTVEICNLTNHVLRICSDTNGTQCVDIDDVIVTEPQGASIDILSAHLYPNDIPLGDEDVGFEVLLGNPRRNPTCIRVFADYYIGTNVWGVANWSGAPFGSIELVQDPENEYLYRSYSGDMILGLPVDSVVQYRIRVTFDGAFSAPVLGTSFENPSWYEPVDLNAMYGTTSASDITPYYFVFSCPTGVVRINEFYPSYGTAYNQREFVELIGPANLSLEGWKLDIVEGGDSAFEDCVTSTCTMPAGTRLSEGGATNGWGFLVIGDDGGSVADKVDLVWPDSGTANLPPTTTNRGGGLRLRRSMGAYVDRVSYGGGNNGNPANAMADRGYTFAGTRPNYAACCYSLETQPGEEGDEWIWNCRKVGATVGEMNPTYTAPNQDGQYTDAVDGIEWTYVISNGVATVGSGSISGARAVPTATEGAISIPSMLGGCPVTGIGNYAFANCTNLTSLTMSSSVAAIGDYAFSECPGLVSITISESLTSIGRYAFNKCSGLPSVSIPASVTRIGYEAFSGCRGLAEVHISDLAAWCGISFGSFYYSNPLYTAQHLFLNGEEVVDLVIPDGVTNITYVAFVGGRNFQSVTIPSSVTSIGYSAFSCCSGLTAVHIHDLASWCKISFGANYDSNPLYNAGHLFLNGTEVTNLTIPSGTTRIGNYAFCGCDGLASVAIPDCVTCIGHAAFFGCTGLTAITIPDSVTDIGDDAFANCTALENVFVDAGNPVYFDLNGVLFSDDGAAIIVFPAGRSGRYGIPDGVETIADSAFRGCTGLTSIAIPDSVNEIGSYAFYGCTGLTSITIPDSVAGIGFNAFSGCRGLTTITIPEALSPRASYWGLPSRCEILIAENVRTLHVDATAGDDAYDGLSWATAKASIQAAIDNSTAGYTIYVGPGEYVVCEDGDLISSALRIVATDGPGATCLRGCVFYDNASAGDGTPPFSLEGFTAENAYFWGVSMSNCVLTADGEPGSASGAEDCFLADCVVTGNRCENNGIFYNCSLLRCTVAGNVVAGETVLARGYGGEVQDSIVWGNVNESGEQANWANASQVPFFEHSCTWPLPRNGEGNIDADPMLVDAANGDLRIRVGSPCIENGVQTMGAVLSDPVEPPGQLPDGQYTATVDGINWTFRICDEEACVGTSSSPAVPENTTGAIAIPSMLGGWPVTGIDNYAFADCNGLTSVTIPDGVTNVGNDSFSGCSGLTSVTIPNSVTNIGERAFQYCRSLESVTIPNSVTNVGNYAFQSCSGLAFITVPEALFSKTSNWGLPRSCEILLPGQLPCGDHTATVDGVEWTFNITNGVASVTGASPVSGALAIPATLGGRPVTGIATSSFENCGELTTITIPTSVTNIGQNAFCNCRSLASMVIPDGVTVIEDHVFSGCSELSSVTIPASVTSIGDFAFSGCTSLASVRIPYGVTSIGNDAFSGCTSLASMRIPYGVTSIGNDAFSGCTGLTQIVVPDALYDRRYEWGLPPGCAVIRRSELPDAFAIATETLPDAVEREPYEVQLESVNGTAPVRWEMVERGFETAFEAGTFSASEAASSWSVTSGSSTTNVALPFTFPFYGMEYDSVWINGYGCLDFGTSSWSSGDYFNAYRKCIVPFGDWISPRSSNPTELWVEEGTESILFRFSCYGVRPSANEDFAVELFSDGRIRFRYGDTCTSTYSSLNITVSAGDGRRYASFTRETWNGMDDIVFTPTWVASSGELPRGLALSESGALAGEVGHYGNYSFSIRATDGEGDTDIRTFSLPVAMNANLRPVLDTRLPAEDSITAPVGLPVHFHVSGHDPEGVALDYVWTVNGVEAERNATGDFHYVPKRADSRYDSTEVRCLLSDGFWTNEISTTFWVTAPTTYHIDPACSSEIRDGLSWATAYRSFDDWIEQSNSLDPSDFRDTGIAFLLAPGEHGVSPTVGRYFERIGNYGSAIITFLGVSGPEQTVLRYGESLRYALGRGSPWSVTGVELKPEDGYDGLISLGSSSRSTASLRQCILRNARFSLSGCRLQDCLVVNGTGTVSRCSIDHCTIAGNTVSDSDGFYDVNGNFVDGDSPLRCVVDGGTVVNSIVRDNRGTNGEIRNYPSNAEITEWYRQWYGYNQDQMVPAFTNSCTSPLPGAGPGNIAGDPLFAEPEAGDFRLRPESPCRDAGVSMPGLADGVDVSGYDRVQGSLPDMGAYEGGLVRFGGGWRTTSGDAPWTDVSPAGDDPGTTVRSGNIADGRETWMDIDQTGAGTLGFRWSVSSEPRYDRLGVFLDGAVLRRISGEVPWEEVSVPVPDGPHRIRICYAKSASGAAGEDAGFLADLLWTAADAEELTLAVALDASGLVWNTDGDPAWLPQRETTFDGVDAARIDAPAEQSESGLSTRIAGPGILSFQWLVESDGGLCGMDVLVDGVPADSCGEDAGWNRRTMSIPDGEHTVRWVFWSDADGAASFACLDQVSWSGSVPGPEATQTTPVPVPYAWLDECGLGDGTVSVYETVANATAANGVNKVWECYVAGLAPTDTTARFEATITMDANGKPVISWNPPLPAAEAAKREYRILGAETLDAPEPWPDVTDVPDRDAAGYRFFKVKVRMKE